MGEDSEEFRNFVVSNWFEPEGSIYACTGNARGIVEKALEQFGVSGQIWEVMAHADRHEIDVSHSYVTLENQLSTETALNQIRFAAQLLTVGEVQLMGVDITELILSSPWEMLK